MKRSQLGQTRYVPSKTMVNGRWLAQYGMDQAELAQTWRFPTWADMAYAILCSYASEHPSGFTTELVRAYAESNGLPPSNGSPWGNVVRRAVREGIIQCAGFEQSSNPSRHLNPVRIWRKRSVEVT